MVDKSCYAKIFTIGVKMVIILIENTIKKDLPLPKFWQ